MLVAAGVRMVWTGDEAELLGLGIDARHMMGMRVHGGHVMLGRHRLRRGWCDQWRRRNVRVVDGWMG